MFGGDDRIPGPCLISSFADADASGSEPNSPVSFHHILNNLVKRASACIKGRHDEHKSFGLEFLRHSRCRDISWLAERPKHILICLFSCIQNSGISLHFHLSGHTSTCWTVLYVSCTPSCFHIQTTTQPMQSHLNDQEASIKLVM